VAEMVKYTNIIVVILNKVSYNVNVV